MSVKADSSFENRNRRPALKIRNILSVFSAFTPPRPLRGTAFIIEGNLYKLGSDEILRCYVPEFEQNNILAKGHGGAVGGHYAGKATMQNILRTSVGVPNCPIFTPFP